MKQAASLNDVELDMLLPGVKVNTSSTDFAPVKQWQLMRFEGANWQLFGDVINGETRE
jgi:branched-chain amino acid transport system substrate-binding protein